MQFKKGDVIEVVFDAGLDLTVMASCSAIEAGEPITDEEVINEFKKLDEVKEGKRNYVLEFYADDDKYKNNILTCEVEHCENLEEKVKNTIKEELSKLGVTKYSIDNFELEEDEYYTSWDITVEE